MKTVRNIKETVFLFLIVLIITVVIFTLVYGFMALLFWIGANTSVFLPGAIIAVLCAILATWRIRKL